MQHRFLVFKRKWQVPLHLASALIPAPLMLGAYAGIVNPYAACAVVGIYILAAMIAIILPDKLRIPGGMLGIALILAYGFMQTAHFKSPALVLSPVLYAWLLFETLPVYGRDAREELPPHVFVLGAVLHLGGQFALLVSSRTATAMFDAVKPGLSIGFIAFFVLTLLNFNRINLLFVAAMEKTVPKHIYRFNRGLTLGLAGLTLLIGCAPSIVRFISGIWKTVIGLIARLIAWFHSLFPVPEHIGESEASGPRDPLVPYAESEPGLLARILEIVMYLLIAAVAILAVWMLIKYFRRFIKWLAKRFREYAAASSTGDYVDEISDTREDGDHKRIFSGLRRRKDPLRGVNPKKLPPAERIRFYYLRLLMGHQDWKSASTARENLPDSAASIYERARYSNGAVSAQDAETFQQETMNM